jgi:HNH endonuclease
MGFPEKIKLEVKKRAHYHCVLCRQAVFVEVHHITPQSEGGPDTLENAAPLCPSCHSDYGGNPDKRKWIRETRDFWWEYCKKRTANPEVVELNKKLDAIKAQVESNYESHSKALESAKQAFLDYHARSGYNIKAATDFNSLSGVTGISVPPSLLDCPKCGGPNEFVAGREGRRREFCLLVSL